MISRRKKKTITIIAMIIAAFVILQPVISGTVFAETATGTKVKYKGAISSMGTTCGKFEIKGNDAFCAEHPKATPPTGTKITSTKVVSNNTMRKALYYGYGGPEAKVKKNNSGWVSTSVALSQANGKGGGTPAAKKFYNSLKNYSKPPESFKVYYCTTAGAKQDLCYWTYTPSGKVRVKKSSSDSAASASKGYSLSGAVYGVYTNKSCTSGSRVAKLTTGSKGISDKISLKKDTYYIKEITAPNGFKLSSTVYKVSVTDQCDKTVSVKDTPKKGSIQLVKSSSKPEITSGNNGYSLSGARYDVWSDSALTKKVGSLTTKSDGKSNILPVFAGKYYIKEVTAPRGYLKDDKTYTIELKINELDNTKTLSVKETPEDDPAWVMLQKIDAESGEAIPSGDGELAGAEFTVKYYEGTDWTGDPAESGASDKGTWIFKTNENGFVRFDNKEHFVSGDEFYYNNFGNPSFPVGTITIQETKAPKGYNLNNEIFTVKIPKDDNESGVSLSQLPTTEVKQYPIRGDLEIMKSDNKTGKAMAGVVFEVIDVSEDKVVSTLVTDENGYATTASGENPEGSLLYGDYIIREKEAPIGYVPIDDINVKISEHKKTVTVDIKNVPAEIKTTAAFKENGLKEILPGEIITIVDEVSYKNLIPGTTYKIKGVLMDKSTGEPLLSENEKITSEMEFTAEEADGTINMEFILNASELSGKSVTVFEDLYIDDIQVASHADINDVNQTVKFTGVGDVEIYKTDSVTGKSLEGVKFQIIDKLTDKVVATLETDSKGYATTADDEAACGTLLYGDYIIREVEASQGYYCCEDIQITIDDENKLVTLNVENKPMPYSKVDTGDNTGKMILYTILLLVVSGFASLITVRKSRA